MTLIYLVIQNLQIPGSSMTVTVKSWWVGVLNLSTWVSFNNSKAMIIIFRNHPLTSHCKLHGDSKQGVKEEVIYAEIGSRPNGKEKAKGRKAQESAEWLCLLVCGKTRKFFLQLWLSDLGEIIPLFWASVSSFVLWGHRMKWSLRQMPKKPNQNKKTPQKPKPKKPFHYSSVSLCISMGIAMHWCEPGPLHCATCQFHHHWIFHSIFFFTMSENRLHSALKGFSK